MADISFFQQLVKQFYTDPKYSDITFLVEDTEFKLHKIILAYSCPYFEAMLFGNTNEAKQSVIELKQTPKHLFKAVIDFIHTGRINKASFNRNDLFALIGLSHEYQFKQFTVYLSKDLKPGSGLNEIVETFVMADKYELSKLREKCAKEIDGLASTITSSKEVFVKLPLSLVTEIVSRNTFESNELLLFRRLVEWKEANNDEDITKSFRELRLNHIPVKDFNAFIKPTGLLTSDDYLQSLEKCLPQRKQRNDAKYLPSNFTVPIPCLPVAIYFTKVTNGIRSHQRVINFSDDQQSVSLGPGEGLVFELENTCELSIVQFMLTLNHKANISYSMFGAQQVKEVCNVRVAYDVSFVNDFMTSEDYVIGSVFRKVTFFMNARIGKWVEIEAKCKIRVKPNSIRCS